MNGGDSFESNHQAKLEEFHATAKTATENIKRLEVELRQEQIRLRSATGAVQMQYTLARYWTVFLQLNPRLFGTLENAIKAKGPAVRMARRRTHGEHIA